ncbi:MAG: SMP-30/Gluconolaconase/LRE domain protein [Cyanobacteria bacterium RYN_339]|nr:SMP-30/Gluconolaconase/LRE domain protein [Cyanobacteria bacterium RYN_339]
MRWTLALAMACLASCVKPPAAPTRPAGPSAAPPALSSAPAASAVGPTGSTAVPTPGPAGPGTLPGPVLPIISDNGGGLTGKVKAPAALISNNGGSVVSNNGGAATGNVRARQILEAPAEVPVPGVRVSLSDAAGRPIVGSDGQPLVTTTDAQGSYRFAVEQVPHNSVLAATFPATGAELKALVPSHQGALQVDAGLVSTLTTVYILDHYVAAQGGDAQVVLDRLPASVEADTRAKAASALVAVPDDLTPAKVVAAVEALRKADKGFDSQLETVRQLMVLGSASASSTDGPALEAQLNGPRGLAVGPDGTLFFADAGNHLIRKLTRDGQVKTVAGSGAAGNADGPANAASFFKPSAVACDAAGNVFVVDCTVPEQQSLAIPLDMDMPGWGLIRQISPDGTVRTLPLLARPGDAESGAFDVLGPGVNFVPRTSATSFPRSTLPVPVGLAINAAGRPCFVTGVGQVFELGADNLVKVLAGTRLGGISNDGTGTAAGFGTIRNLVGDAAGNLFVLEDAKVRKLAPSGEVTTVARLPQAASQLALDGAGGFAFVATDGGTAWRWAPGDKITQLATGLDHPRGVAVAAGTVYVSDTAHNVIRRSDASGGLVAAAGSGKFIKDGAAATARLKAPTGVVGDGQGSLYVSDTGNHVIRKVTPDGIISTFAGSETAGSADGQGAAAGFTAPTEIALAGDHNLYVVDGLTIRQITPAGVVTTPVRAATAIKGLVADAQGRITYNDGDVLMRRSADGTLETASYCGWLRDTQGCSGSLPDTPPYDRLDGKPHTENRRGAVGFVGSGKLALDAKGSLYVAEANNLHALLPSGAPVPINEMLWLTTSAPFPTINRFVADGLAVDGQGAIFRSYGKDHAVAKMGFAGSHDLMPKTPLGVPAGLWWDGKGSLWVVDQGNSVVLELKGAEIQ